MCHRFFSEEKNTFSRLRSRPRKRSQQNNRTERHQDNDDEDSPCREDKFKSPKRAINEQNNVFVFAPNSIHLNMCEITTTRVSCFT